MSYTKKEIPEYLKKDFDTDLLPCPRCGSEYVEWTNCRDLNILSQYVSCLCCELSTFHVETIAFTSLENLDYETSVKKYNSWVLTNPTIYSEEDWSYE